MDATESAAAVPLAPSPAAPITYWPLGGIPPLTGTKLLVLIGGVWMPFEKSMVTDAHCDLKPSSISASSDSTCMPSMYLVVGMLNLSTFGAVVKDWVKYWPSRNRTGWFMPGLVPLNETVNEIGAAPDTT